MPGGVRKWAGLALLALPTVLLGLDVTVLYLVAPSVAADLSPSGTQLLWIMDAYGFFIAGFLITMGTLGDRIGRRRLLMIGMVAFAAASVCAAFAPTAGLLILARALLGIAGATLMPSTLSLVSNMFPEARERAVAIGVWATMFALGMAAGPIVGGVLVDALWWGAPFLLAVPVAIVVLIGARALLPEYADPGAGQLDLVSVALSLGSILPAIYAVKHLAASEADGQSLAFAAMSLVAGLLFIRRQRRLAHPLLDLALFTNRAFSAALVVLLIGLVGVGGSMYLVTQYLQLVEGLSPFAAGLWMGPPALAMFAVAIGAPVIARRIRPGVVMGVTLGISLIGYGMLASAGLDDELHVAVGFAFVYLGLGAIAALGTDIVIGAVPASKSGSAAALSETVQELGIAVGVALLGSLTTGIYRRRIDDVPAGLDADAADALSDSLNATISIADALPAQSVESARLAFTTGLNTAALVAGVAIALATVLCFRLLRHVPRLELVREGDTGR